jgi:(p)ppGpp synthase/HD superfamily hydrolase
MLPKAKELHSEDYVNIWFHEDTNTLEMEWLDYVSSYRFKPSLEQALELAVQQNARYWLANRVQMRELNDLDRKWVTDTWLPQFLEHNFKKLAVVEPANALHRVFEDQVLHNSNGSPIEIKCFQKRSEAMDWIEEDFEL